jgi:(E)-4-hydroxy-3-methylbut-2-enyl-diphosphate synthase
VTEAGIYRTGTVKSAIALGGLLMEGIGDTMRISLAAEPEDEIKIGFDILKSLGFVQMELILLRVQAVHVKNLM